MPSPGDIKQTLAPKVLEFIPNITVIHIALLATISVTTMIAVLYTRKALIKRQLKNRVSARHLPVTKFDPSAEEVHRAARRLTRTRPALWAAAPAPGAAVRVRLATEEGGMLTYRLEGPQSARSIIEGRLFDGVEVFPEKAGGGELGSEEKTPHASPEEGEGGNSAEVGQSPG
ncbi:hypothetical protein [Nocardiopsis sp. CNT312]|uniref:hypothetical protein n=1 Tax=Nocardiopsis sp. CNT312 TaxID=1137268 RepID=UPI0004AF16C1|nr:hypothetical protein [Nocardiopsis sp. CNT312]